MDFVNFTIEHPCTMSVIGPTSSGKSRLVYELIRRRAEIFSKPDISKIIWVYKDFQPLFRQLQLEEPGVTFVNSVHKLRDSLEPDCIVVLDDQTSALNKSDECQIIKDFYTVHSHHTPCTLIGIWQTAFHKQMREINLNSQVLVMLDFPRDKTIIANIARQSCPSQVKFLQSAYNHAVEKDWGHIVLDFHPKHKRMAFARSSLFPSENCVVYVP